MRTTIDAAGRLVVPKALRDELGLAPGPVDLTILDSALRVAPAATDDLIERDGYFMLPHATQPLSDDDVRELRVAGQR